LGLLQAEVIRFKKRVKLAASGTDFMKREELFPEGKGSRIRGFILFPVREERKDFPRTGAGKLQVYLKPKFEAMHPHTGRDAFIELPYRNSMPKRKVKNRRRTAFPNHRMHKYANPTSGYTPAAPNRLWVSDITYIETRGDVSCLSLITDACSRRIAGWRTLRFPGSPAAQKMALKPLSGKHPELIRLSDRGSRYGCNSHVGKQSRKDIQICMAGSGDPRENAMAERIGGILKTAWICGRKRSCFENSFTKREQ
jgi:transposase InsO family protein